jgi:hypothetical protein
LYLVPPTFSAESRDRRHTVHSFGANPTRAARIEPSHAEVEVLHDGRWVRGWLLHAYRTADGRWRGVVRYTVGVGMTYQQGRDESELRRPAA